MTVACTFGEKKIRGIKVVDVELRMKMVERWGMTEKDDELWQK